MNTPPNSPHSLFVTSFSKALANAFSDATKTDWQAEAAKPIEPHPSDPTSICFQLALGGGLQGQASLVLTSADMLHLASELLGRPAESIAEEHGAAFLNTLQASTAVLIDDLLAQHGAVTVQASKAENLDAAGTAIAHLRLSADSKPGASAVLHVSPDLLQAIAPQASEAKPNPPTSNAKAPSSSSPLPDEKRLQRVIDVALNVKLRFGQRQLSLREVLDLTSGSLVELDRQVEEPVDLMLDGRIIARGEVVIVDGNYGMRVTEIPPLTSALFER